MESHANDLKKQVLQDCSFAMLGWKVCLACPGHCGFEANGLSVCHTYTKRSGSSNLPLTEIFSP